MLSSISVTIRIPRLADSTVPAVDGETNRLRASICMIMPVILVEAPTRMIARESSAISFLRELRSISTMMGARPSSGSP